MMEIYVDLLWMVSNCFDNTYSGGEIMPKKQLVEEFEKPIIKKLEKHEVDPSFIDNFWGANQANMQLTCKYSKEFRCLLCAIDIYSKYAQVVPLKDKKGN